MRGVLDDVEPENLQSLFPKRYSLLKQLGVHRDYRFLKKYQLLSVDGVHYFESNHINGKRCIQKNHINHIRNGKKVTSYSHSMLVSLYACLTLCLE